MKFNQTVSITLFAVLMLSGCGGLFQVKLSNEPLGNLPANYVDARDEKSKRSFESGASTYYGDDYLEPSVSALFLSRLYQELGADIGEKRVALERADVTATLPFAYFYQGWPGAFLTEPKFVRVDLAGHVGDVQFTHGITNRFYFGPSAGDIRETVDKAVREAIALIRQQMPR